jgi:hypothetical protein
VTPDVHITASSRRAARLLRQELQGYDAEIVRDGSSWEVVLHNPDAYLLYRIAEAARAVVDAAPDVELHLLDEGRRVKLPPG